MTDRAALVKKARIEALRVFNHEPGGTSPSAWWGAAIDLIRADVLEEAAVVFDRYENDPFTAAVVADHLRRMKGAP